MIMVRLEHLYYLAHLLLLVFSFFISLIYFIFLQQIIISTGLLHIRPYFSILLIYSYPYCSLLLILLILLYITMIGISHIYINIHLYHMYLDIHFHHMYIDIPMCHMYINIPIFTAYTLIYICTTFTGYIYGFQILSQIPLLLFYKRSYKKYEVRKQ